MQRIILHTKLYELDYKDEEKKSTFVVKMSGYMHGQLQNQTVQSAQ